jgi:cytosine deaminase
MLNQGDARFLLSSILTTDYTFPMSDAQRWMDAAYEQALEGYEQGGLPIGSVLVDASGSIVARGHNLRVQTGDPTAHAEVVCIRNAGRRRDWPTLTLVSTLSPCIMCTGTALLYRIPRVIVGEHENFMGAERMLREHGVELTALNDPRCIELMQRFVDDKPDLWNEDIGV